MAIQRFDKFMVLVKKPIVLFTGILLALTSCSSQGEGSVQEGVDQQAEAKPAKTLFIMHCESCHGMTGDKGSSGAANLRTSTLSDAEILKVIVEGNDKGMMPYKLLIPREDERSSLVDYVKTLRD